MLRALASAAALCAAAALRDAPLTLRDAPLAAATPLLYLDSPGAAWTASEPSLGLAVPATVPGDIVSDLQRARVIGDPYYELTFLDNRTLWDAAARAWNFSTTVALPPPGAAPGAALLLVFEGIKMGARVALNGVPLGAVTNQFARAVFELPAAAVAAGGGNRLDVVFDGALPLAGRYMACSGGWDWAFFSQLQRTDVETGRVETTFSSGIWKSVYVAAVAPAAAAVTALTPRITYLGAYPVGALVDGAHAGFSVNVTAHLWAPPGGATGTLSLAGAWAGAAAASPLLTLAAGDSTYALTLAASAAAIRLWWPNGLGGQPLYNLTATWTPAAGGAGGAATAVRRVGFRTAALVTVNDTNATVVQESTGANGSGSGFGLFFRINGVAIYARGGNVVPMEELEGRLDAVAYATLVNSAADVNMNMLRVWGGGIYPPDVFYDTCDERGVLLYHDLQFARGDFLAQPLSAATTASLLAEIAHQVRRLAAHPALVLYDSNNEDIVEPSGPSALYATLILTAVAAEDASRILWPNSPSTGWRSGVDRLWGTPNGAPLVALGGGHDYFAGQEWHRFYQAGVGAGNWSTVVRDPWTQAHTFNPMLPPSLDPGGATGAGARSYFVSEFGSATMSSFESMSGTLAPGSWGLHGGGVAETCIPMPGAFGNNCTGRNAMTQRNWACDNIVWSYFGPTLINASGEVAFKGALFQCMVAGALNMQSVVEGHRGANAMGTLEWQLNEVWPTGGWGSLEYGSAASPGSLRGGRWKPMHNWFASHIFADVMAACGFAGRSRAFVCYVSNARADRPFAGTLTLTAVDLATGAARAWATLPVAVAAGPGALAWAAPNATLPNATTTLLVASLVDAAGGGVFDEHVVHMTAPANLRIVAPVKLSLAVAAAPNADGSVNVTVAADAVALFVTLTAMAPGRFSDNAFLLLPGAARNVTWIPFVAGDAAADYALLAATIRVEDMSAYAGVGEGE